jgi:SAM-dependent methyltransferase
MKKLAFLTKEVSKGKSILRSFLNYDLKDYELKGKTIDIGGGKNSDYIAFMKRSLDIDFLSFDIKAGASIDFEKDSLPSQNDTFDTVLFLNVMEHIFNHQHIANEVMRITKPGGQMLGYVPFLMWYHPDHKDFFRYTHEALEIIFQRAGAKSVQIIPNYCGPFIAAAQMAILSFPKIFRPFIFICSYILDEIFFAIKRTRNSRYILGYLFLCKK